MIKSLWTASFGAALLACVSSTAIAQTSPNLTYGQVPTAGQWNQFFSSKQDVLNQVGPGSLFANCGISNAIPSGCSWNTFASQAIGNTGNLFIYFDGTMWTTVGRGNGLGVTGVGLEPVSPVQTINGASHAFGSADLYTYARRSNSGAAMTDTFPAAITSGLVNGTRIQLSNVDASASDTVTAGAGTTINGGSSIVIGAGRSTDWVYDLGSTAWRPTANSIGGVTVVGSLTPHGVVIGEGLNSVVTAAPMTAGQILVGQASADPVPKTVSGDVTINNSGATTVGALNGNALGLTSVTAGNVLLGSGTALVSTPVTGAFTLSGAGVATLSPNAVSLSQMAQAPTLTFLCNSSGVTANLQSCPLYASNNTALTATSTAAVLNGTIYRAGFTSAGDGGSAMYVASGSACTLNSGAGDNGAQVRSADGKCWVAQFPATGADVRVWGARVGQNIDAPLNAAIAWACTTHVPLTLPYPLPTTPYFLNSSVQIGNGTATHYSDCNAISFSITQPLPEAANFNTVQAAIAYNGTDPNVIPIVVQGPLASVHLYGLNVSCSNICKTGIKISNSLDSDYGWLGVQGNCGPGFVVTSVVNNTFFSGNEGSRFHDWQASFPTCAGGSGMQVGDLTGLVNGAAVVADMFDNVTLNFDANTASSCGINLGYTTQLTFTNLRIAPMPGTSGSGHAVCITPPTNTSQFPTAITFLHPFIFGGVQDPGSAWTGTIPLNFINWSTVDEAFPTSTNLGLFVGTDDKGFTYPARQPWTPVDTSGAGLALTVSDASYQKNGNFCTVVFNITFPTNANGSPAGIGGIPCPITFSSNSFIGGSPSFTDVATPFTITVSDQTATQAQMNFFAFGGGQVANSAFSGKTVRGSVTYFLQ